MSDFGSFLVVMLFFVSLILIGATTVYKSNTYKMGELANTLIERCEESLPRDQNCTIEASIERGEE